MSNSFLYTFVPLVSIIFYLLFRRHLSKPPIPSTCRSPRVLPQTDPIFGLHHFWKTLKLRQQHRSLETLVDWHTTYGHTFKVISLGTRVFHTAHPDNVNAVFGTKWRDWITGRFEAMNPFCGRGFVDTDGEEWRAHRALLAPTLNEASAINLESLNVAFDEYLANIPVDETTVDLAPIFEELFLDLSLQFLFGRKLSTLRSADSHVDMRVFQNAFDTAQFWMGIRLAFGIIGRTFPTRKFKQSCQIVHSFVDYYVGLALREMSNEVLNNQEHNMTDKIQTKASLIQSLGVQGRNPIEIRSEIIQGMLVTQDTTGIVLSNTIFLLSRTPVIWERLRKEVATLGPYKEWNAPALKNLKLLHNILKESLRLHPLFASNSRVAAIDTILPTGGGPNGSAPIYVPAGSKVSVSYYTLHRQKSVFGEDVEIFNPDRWNHISPDSWEFLPFSHGPRSCAGRHKALGEASYIIARMASEFARIESRDDRAWTEDVKLVVRNFHGCKVSLYAT
ncbi:Cytochrome P450 monooxygenase fsdH [Lachnellula arida]|uniref:Cytochrome P450 monooxygenase fsdH n=1 Tax=Lachnellula arida TaxID=1316785 RepID=A0A8T9B3H7_9HELO|nr:Cytochrome P450 monooxygenase fsdH [Lachnellula arida]